MSHGRGLNIHGRQSWFELPGYIPLTAHTPYPVSICLALLVLVAF